MIKYQENEKKIQVYVIADGVLRCLEEIFTINLIWVSKSINSLNGSNLTSSSYQDPKNLDNNGSNGDADSSVVDYLFR